jgi:hypothetical protein
MAAPLVCDEQDGEVAKFILGNAETGEQTFLCPAGMARFGLAMAISYLDPQQIIAEVQQAQAQTAANGQEQTPPKRGRKSKPKPVAEPAADGPAVPGVAETSPPADDGGDRGL